MDLAPLGDAPDLGRIGSREAARDAVDEEAPRRAALASDHRVRSTVYIHECRKNISGRQRLFHSANSSRHLLERRTLKVSGRGAWPSQQRACLSSGGRASGPGARERAV